MELLKRNFDVVTIGDHDSLVKQVLELTGWDEIPIPYTNSFKGELVFMKKQVKNLQKLFAANGDLEFGDAVKMRYNGYLNYTNERRYNTSGAPEFASVFTTEHQNEIVPT
jgi:hypothetical protein|eukprot:g5138.t1 g5138   contig19:9830-10159(-)